ncbi:50S ribosomal protein L18Ae [Thermofilum sp.]|jgi:large subunit ribosomal protein LX|uniref:50S ribosomal protein L18Ae n=1 Tax=Thermofilum sp. TaxID=1961369 RepID=UPI0025858DC3|nr:50S ribosomal protein L18Ae [Thermofilum sp.]
MVSVKTFEVSGTMRLRLGEQRKFRIYVRGLSEDEAKEKVYSILGSRHKLTRNHIKIASIREVPLEEVQDEYVRDLAQADKIVAYVLR